MKKLLLLSLLITLQIATAFSQSKADDIVGFYLATDPKTKEVNQMEIYKAASGKYEGKVVWVENKKKQHLVGTVQLKNLVYDAKNQEWNKGKVMHDGDEYSLKISIPEPGKLKLRGFLGISLLGKTMYWPKEECLRK